MGSAQGLLSAGRAEGGMFLHKWMCSDVSRMNSWIDRKLYLLLVNLSGML